MEDYEKSIYRNPYNKREYAFNFVSIKMELMKTYSLLVYS